MKKLILFELALLFLATTFSSSPPPQGWYQQTLPVSDQINDIFFLDSLNGWIVTPSGYILNTTNGGNDWNIQKDSAGNLFTVQFLDLQNGYVIGNGLHGIIYKTSNGGLKWNLIHDFSPASIFRDMSFVNKDTGWVCSQDVFDGGVFKTTDGGTSWVRQLNLTTGNPHKIFFVNNDTGWIGNNHGQLYKSTNSGLNWNLQYTFSPTSSDIRDILFTTADTGWVSESYENVIQFTSNGGNNWVIQTLPPKGGTIAFSQPEKFSSLNGKTIWGGGGTAFLGMGKFRGIIYKSTNSGFNWNYQIPDTSISIFNYTNIQFVNDSMGWASNTGLIHTFDGGGPLVRITDLSSASPRIFTLFQNYPNPFNPVTNLEFRISEMGLVSLKVYDLLGKEVAVIVESKLNPGTYKYEFDGRKLNSGVYFYRLVVINEKTNEVFSETMKMLLVK